jgi:dTDP-4-amino-4,6-dideoxygalactose transaminase
MKATIKVPFGDLHAQYISLKDDIDNAVAEVIRNSAFIRGKFVDNFESEFASLTRSQNCVSCANGTDSLLIAMKALGIKPGDEVIVPAHTWISTSETVTLAGGRVVFADTDKDSFTISISDVEQRVTSRTVGIIPVHLFGHPADMDELCRIAKKYGLWIIEDCAQAHLSTYKGRPVGSFGNAASYSFYPGKNLGAMGDAGAITCNDDALARKMAMFARHGGLSKGDHQIEGMNSRLDGIQAAILSVKMKKLPEWTSARRLLADFYRKTLSGEPKITLPVVQAWAEHVWHLYVIKVENRDEIKARMEKVGIQTVVNYPTALPLVPAYEYLGLHANDYPNAWHNQSRILSIPLYPEISSEQQMYVANQLLDIVGTS